MEIRQWRRTRCTYALCIAVYGIQFLYTALTRLRTRAIYSSRRFNMFIDKVVTVTAMSCEIIA